MCLYILELVIHHTRLVTIEWIRPCNPRVFQIPRKRIKFAIKMLANKFGKIISVFCLKWDETGYHRARLSALVILDFDKWSVFKMVYSTLRLNARKAIGLASFIDINTHPFSFVFFSVVNFIFILRGMRPYVRCATMHRHTAILRSQLVDKLSSLWCSVCTCKCTARTAYHMRCLLRCEHISPEVMQREK